MADYKSAGVDVAAGERAVELMKAAVQSAQRLETVGAFGGFAGLFDASALKNYRKPLLVTGTDGVGTKIQIARELNKHDSIGIDLVAMVVDDIVTTGAEPLFITDYIATGKVNPELISQIVSGIAAGAKKANVSLLGGETAEHPGVMADDDYDLACAGTGVVEADDVLGEKKVKVGDVVLALRSSGLHSNGYSLVRKIIAERNLNLKTIVPDFGKTLGEELLTPTEIYCTHLLKVIKLEPNAIHAISHITGGGISANLARVIPESMHIDLDKSSWQPQEVFRYLAAKNKTELIEFEHTFNLGIGMLLVVSADKVSEIKQGLTKAGQDAWLIGEVVNRTDQESDAKPKGGNGGSVRLINKFN
ncbi:MAG: phosphoribosylformylglycinamidine cyclo-ligase [Actinobacteria bacterium]|nr:phosphoribosylformylglycinamidine cyclo-ligase [Actinomycetota bacterium]